MSFDYSQDPLIDHNWPHIAQVAGGMWHATWVIDLASRFVDVAGLDTVAEDISSELTSVVRGVTGSPDESFTIRLRADGHQLNLETRTSSHLIGAENCLAIGELFKAIDRQVGEILRIQGQARELWPPWGRGR